MINTMPFVGPAVPVQPVPINVKLAAINAMLDQKHKPRAKQVSSSPNLTLDLRHPVQPEAYFYVHGLWQPLYGSVSLSAQYHDRVCLVFTAPYPRPYLLDVSVDSTPARDLDWRCRALYSSSQPKEESCFPKIKREPHYGDGQAFRWGFCLSLQAELSARVFLLLRRARRWQWRRHRRRKGVVKLYWTFLRKRSACRSIFTIRLAGRAVKPRTWNRFSWAASCTPW